MNILLNTVEEICMVQMILHLYQKDRRDPEVADTHLGGTAPIPPSATSRSWSSHILDKVFQTQYGSRDSIHCLQVKH